ncbi:MULTISPECIES: TIGR03862 family flavoprotein [Agrobacterium]|uniref:TIGR03862 family flavoprotein n=1 Tax=Agrobacterium rosae TaxID=1972867 RepID=A0AAW9FEQ0_9HYPH|nr:MULTISPECIES: TIGR03862 family flavoprotein [Agrobacterium]MBN7806875.1 TIGR03862 family flavoprotein [Agrobacterium rosae]MDX8303951.1 TIGR03862 family flavoprotein [Agrobacterium rosae]SCX11575.1 dihydropyrimidine dehydrogenase subunit A [Agrobacterium sp. DSM 25558]
MHGKTVAIIGGGPAGLMAADVLSAAGLVVTVYEAMPTVARKFLMAGKSGLNITHAEGYDDFVTRFGTAQAKLQSALDDFTPAMLRDWALSLGQETFTGTSGRVFPVAMKASPLLRAWLSRLNARRVEIKTRHRWAGFDGDALLFQTPSGNVNVRQGTVLLALGGASWPKLGSDAAWVPWLRQKGVTVNDFQPANCGFDVEWSDHFVERFAGAPVKSVVTTSQAGRFEGEFVITRHGIEGSLVYAHSAALRDAFQQTDGPALIVDLAPGRTQQRLTRDLERHPRKDSLSNRLRKAAGLSPVKVALLRECRPELPAMSAAEIAALIKALPVTVTSPRPIAEAISSAGGIDWEEIDQHYMLKSMPGTFTAGEMLDWEAPTGGYLLTACFATGKAAAKGIIHRLDHDR